MDLIYNKITGKIYKGAYEYITLGNQFEGEANKNYAIRYPDDDNMAILEISQLQWDTLDKENLDKYIVINDSIITVDDIVVEEDNSIPFEGVTPQMYGAKGDGINDDTASINLAILSGKTVYFPEGKYKLTGKLTYTNKDVSKIRLIGNNAEFLYTGSKKKPTYAFRFDDCDVEMSGIKFNFNNTEVGTAGIYCLECNVKLDDMEFCNVNDTNSNYSTIVVNLGDCSVSANNIRFNNLIKRGDSSIGTGAGNITALYLSYSANYDDTNSICEISDIFIKNVCNKDENDNVMFEDTSGVYIIQYYLNPKMIKNIRNIYGYNFGKRLIKLQASHINIENLYGETYNDDTLSIIMMSPPVVTDKTHKDYYKGHYSLKNVTALGTMQAVISAASDHIDIENVYIRSTPAKLANPDLSTGILTTGDYINIRDVVMRDTNVAVSFETNGDKENPGNHITIDNLYIENFDHRHHEGIFHLGYGLSNKKLEDVRIRRIRATVNNKKLIVTHKISAGVCGHLKNWRFEDIIFTKNFIGVDEATSNYLNKSSTGSMVSIHKSEDVSFSNIEVNYLFKPSLVFSVTDCKNVSFDNIYMNSNYRTYIADIDNNPIRIATVTENGVTTKILEPAVNTDGFVATVSKTDSGGFPLNENGKRFSSTRGGDIKDENNNIILTMGVNWWYTIHIFDINTSSGVKITNSGFINIDDSNIKLISTMKTTKSGDIKTDCLYTDIQSHTDLVNDIEYIFDSKYVTTNTRPTNVVEGYRCYDKDIKRYIYWNGDEWITN